MAIQIDHTIYKVILLQKLAINQRTETKTKL